MEGVSCTPKETQGSQWRKKEDLYSKVKLSGNFRPIAISFPKSFSPMNALKSTRRPTAILHSTSPKIIRLAVLRSNGSSSLRRSCFGSSLRPTSQSSYWFWRKHCHFPVQIPQLEADIDRHQTSIPWHWEAKRGPRRPWWRNRHV